MRWLFYKRCMICFIVCTLIVLFLPQSAHAEGSRTYHPPGAPGDRVWLEFITGGPLQFTANIQRLSEIHVYAQEGETIYLGSSAVGIGLGIINYRSPTNVVGSCNAVGYIQDRVQELAGPLPLNPAGYVPCVVVVPAGQTGIWSIYFVSPNPLGGGVNNPPLTPANIDWDQTDATRQASAAWDVTVTDIIGNEVPGRVYADYLALTMGANGTLANPAALDAIYYILTNDGYLYEVDLNRMNPFGFIFFGNNKGFQDGAGLRLYRSVQLTDDVTLNLQPGEFVQNPNAPDTLSDITHKIFFNIPSPDLPVQAAFAGGTTEWLRLPTPFVPPPPSNFQFVGAGGGLNVTGGGQGGRFSFDLPLGYTGSYRVSIDLNSDGDFTDAIDRTMYGTSVPGTTNSVLWDGRDGLGNISTTGFFTYEAEISLNVGEVHFPFIDVEANPNGLVISRLADVNSPANRIDYTIYYDDSSLPPVLGQIQSNPASALGGINSVGGAHGFGTTDNLFTNSYGNIKGIDTWVYVPTPPVRLVGGLQIVDIDLGIEKVDIYDPVDTVVDYRLRVYNVGSSDAIGATVTDMFESYLRDMTWTCEPGAGASCSPTGVGNINDSVTIPIGGEIFYNIRANVMGEAPNPFYNTASVGAPPGLQDMNPSNNQDDELTGLRDRPGTTNRLRPQTLPGGQTQTTSGLISKTVQPPFVATGDAAVYTITINNITDVVMPNVVMTDNVPVELQVVSAAASSGIVTVNGQRINFEQSTLNVGEFVTITVTTQVRSEARVPFLVRNQACLNLTPVACASADLLSVTQLPRTGETPQWRGLVLLCMMGLMLAGGTILFRLKHS